MRQSPYTANIKNPKLWLMNSLFPPSSSCVPIPASPRVSPAYLMPLILQIAIQGHSQSKCMLMLCLKELPRVPSTTQPDQMWRTAVPGRGQQMQRQDVGVQQQNICPVSTSVDMAKSSAPDLISYEDVYWPTFRLSHVNIMLLMKKSLLKCKLSIHCQTWSTLWIQRVHLAYPRYTTGQHNKCSNITNKEKLQWLYFYFYFYVVLFVL